MTRRTKAPETRQGVAAAELAILLPFLAYLFIIALDWSRIIYYSVTVNNCARNGALYLSDSYSSVISPYADLTSAAQADAPNLSPRPTVTSSSGTDANGRAYKECRVTYDFKMLTNFPGVPRNTTISRTVRIFPAPQDPN